MVCGRLGLGKTIISLALILLNPAPLLPTSGSSVAKLDSVDDGESKWDKDLNARCSADKPGRGSILSRGTLVVVSGVRKVLQVFCSIIAYPLLFVKVSCITRWAMD